MADKKTEKSYSAKDFAKKMGGVTKKFNDKVGNVDSSVYADLPKGTYTVEVHPVSFKETANGNFMVRIPFTVVEGEYAKRRGSVMTFIDEKQCAQTGDLAGTPFGIIDVTKNAKNLGVDTAKCKTFDKVLEGLEEVTSIEGLQATVVITERKYTPTKGPNKGKEQITTNSVFSGLVAVEDGEESAEEEAAEEEEIDESEEEDVEDAEEVEEEEDAAPEPQFANKDKVKMKKGRMVLSGVIIKVNDDCTYSVKTDKDKKVHSNVSEDDLEAI